MRPKKEVTKEMVIAAIKQHKFKKDIAAALDLSPTTLWRRVVELGVSLPKNQGRKGKSRPDARKPLAELKSPYSIIRRLIENLSIKNECAECQQPPVWRGKILRLQIDHADGNPENNDPRNLRLLCPNCHTQTETWGFKKRTRA